MVPAGWKVADATQLSYGQALLNKIPPRQPSGPTDSPRSRQATPACCSARLDLKLFAGAETDNTKAAQRLASDMGEFFMPFPGTRVNQETVPLSAGDMTGVASYYEVKFTDTNKPNGQIWAGVVGAPTPAGTPRGQRAPERWFVVWLGTANNPVPRARPPRWRSRSGRGRRRLRRRRIPTRLRHLRAAQMHPARTRTSVCRFRLTRTAFRPE